MAQEGLAVASIALDNPSHLPGMHRHHNAPTCTATRSVHPHALRVCAPTCTATPVHASAHTRAATAMRGKFGSEYET